MALLKHEMGGWRLYTVFLAALLLLFAGGTAAAETDERTVIMSFAETNAPYAWVRNGRVRGLEFEIVTAALELGGYRLEAVPRPYRRLSKILANENVDGVTGVHPNEVPGYYFSEPYMAYENYAIVRKDGAIVLRDVDDLLTHSVVAWQGAFEILDLEHRAPQSFAAANEKTYVEFADQSTTFKYFWSRRADVLLSDRYIYETYLREHPASVREAPPVAYVRLFPENAVRAAFKSREVRDAFDQGLRRFRESGDYQRLVDLYFKPPAVLQSRGN